MRKAIILAASSLVATCLTLAQPSAEFLSDRSKLSDLSVLFSCLEADTLSYFFVWDFGDGTVGNGPVVQHNFAKEGTYLISLTVTDGIIVESVLREMKIQALLDAPNVFTPNDDGYNDLFVINTDGQTEFTLTIYSRAGTIVHRSTSLSPVWDGETPSGAKVHPGVYYYVVRSGNENGNYEKSGFVHLLRESP